MAQIDQIVHPTPKQKIILILEIALVVILLSSGLGYWYWIHTPQYSLKQIQEAVKNHDLQTFEKYVDIDSVTSRMIDQLIDSKINAKNEVQDEAGNLAKGFIQFIKPQLTAMAKDQIRSLVEKGSTLQPSTPGQAEPPDAPKFSVNDIYNNKVGTPDFKGVDYVNKDGKIASVGLKLFYPKLNANVVLEVRMRKLDGYWQIAEISNIPAFLSKLAELEEKKLAEINQPIISEMNNTFKINSVRMVPVQANSFTKAVTFPTEISFLSQKNITEFNVLILAKNQAGKLVLKMPASSAVSSDPGETTTITWSKKINPFISSDAALFNTPPDQLSIEIKPISIKFADGTQLKLSEKLP
ncbi:DUF2939 domain-containing protein [Propionispora hippei]|uniref:DUF2939 domain-containing protein n=1 Tax=Propionispora hippei DSM 15287 TaxID=1123003 RepID=A0A1M6CZL7_9FIRM|nr:DUF2939 domain-containing protein [Propionispora hippei]SHI66472.1 Protein of unknown function [Propionispora hippei DSM 15287]